MSGRYIQDVVKRDKGMENMKEHMENTEKD